MMKLKSGFFLVVGAGLLLGPAAPVWPESVVTNVQLDHPLVLAGRKVPVYALLEFKAVKVAGAERSRPDLNLALVIDRSGSMADRGKITFARKAAKVVVDSLKASDLLAVVEYDDRISVLWPSAPVESKETIKRLIDRLRPRDTTNLTAGMLKGVEEVKKNLNGEHLNRVILLSDGLANQGITNPHAIKHLVRKAKARGVYISTMGLGVHYNEDLMQAIAEVGGGNYYFIEHPNQMSRIYRQEMSILFCTVAKNVLLQFTAGGPVGKAEFIGFQAKKVGSVTKMETEDFFSEETRSIVLRLEVTANQPGPVQLGKIRLTYEDLADNRTRTIERELTVTATTDPSKVQAARNDKVAAEAALTEADREHNDAVKLYERGQKTDAKQKIRGLKEELQQKNKSLSDVRISKKIEALDMESDEMDEAEKTAWARFRYLKRSKISFYKSKKGRRGLYVMEEGDSGIEVEELQRALIGEKVYSGPVDGVFDREVTEAVEEFQRQQGLEVDGVVGPKTMKKLGVY